MLSNLNKPCQKFTLRFAGVVHNSKSKNIFIIYASVKLYLKKTKFIIKISFVCMKPYDLHCHVNTGNTTQTFSSHS